MPKQEHEQKTSNNTLAKRRLWIVLLFATLIVLGALVIGNWFAGKPQGLGATDGRLTKCPDSPNCVCSQESRASHRLAPFQYAGDAEAAFSRLADLLKSWPRTRIVTQTETYLHVEFTTPMLRFVDDGEFLLDAEGRVIHVRSASRIGHTDMGANLKRLEKIRAALESAEG